MAEEEIIDNRMVMLMFFVTENYLLKLCIFKNAGVILG